MTIIPSYLTEDMPDFCQYIFKPTTAQLTIPAKEVSLRLSLDLIVIRADPIKCPNPGPYQS
jgi:hypothetical protein